MKLGKLLLGSLASLALLASCDNKEEDLGAPSIKLNPETVTFTQEGGGTDRGADLYQRLDCF